MALEGERITSLQNPRVKNVVKLRGRRQRERQGLMIIEGYRELRRALDNAVPIREAYYCSDLYVGSNEPGLLADAAAAGAELVAVSAAVFHKIAYRDRPEGLLALAPIPRRGLEDLGADPSSAFLLVAEGIEKPGNLGTILRSADAAGVDGVVVCDAVTDIFNPNTIRASIGAVFGLPVASASSEACLAWLAARGIPSFAATPAGDALYTAGQLRRPCAVVVGSEQYGLSSKWLEGASQRVRIPMRGQADSLNAAQAATLLMFEVLRLSPDPVNPSQ